MIQTKPYKAIDSPVNTLIEKRWSGRAFSDRKVEEFVFQEEWENPIHQSQFQN